MATPVSRLAPSPTGALHLGNVRTFLINWALARNLGWTLLMRIENLDGPRMRPGATAQLLDDLAWLGIDFDGPVKEQSHDLEPYRAAMRLLAREGHVFACSLTRRQIEEAATAPHANDHETRYPPQLRPAYPDPVPRHDFDDERTNYRFIVNDENLPVQDECVGDRTFNPSREVGDFVVWTKRGQPAYQLAVVVDDHRQGVTDVVRGMDLLPSVARQELLYRALGLHPPRWWHLPLVLGPDGRRLAKRHGDTRVSYYRELGVSPQRIIGLLGWWSGVCELRCELTAEEFRQGFALDRLSLRPITFTKDDDRWLCGS